MINPGGFIQRSDIVGSSTLVAGMVIGSWCRTEADHLGNEGIGYISLSFSIPHLNPWARSPFRFSMKHRYLQTENILTIDRLASTTRGYWFDPSEENIKARIKSDWAQYSYATVLATNTYLVMNHAKKKDRYAFLKEHALSKWSWCKYSCMFIPNKLKVSKFIPALGLFKPAFYWFDIEPASIIEAIRSRSQNRFDSGPTLLRNYTDRATNYFSFLTTKKDPSEIFYGLELEYEGRTTDNTVKTADLLKNYAILKRDGSLRNGFEICTAPAHFDVHKESLVNFFNNLRLLGLFAQENTGMHVHISRGPMSFLQLGKIFALLNNPQNEELLVRIAGRNPNNFCRADHSRNNKLSIPFIYPDSQGHYSRLNLGNRDTIEVRMFSTPMTYEDCMHKLEFCKALVDVTTPAAISASSIKEFEKISLLQQHVSRNHKQYPHLSKLIGV